MKNKYYLPISWSDIERSSNKSPAHTGSLKNSIDFICKIGTPICAAAPGIVVWIRKDSKVGGWSKKYWYKRNRIVIKHKNSEYSAYEHLKFRGVLVKIGQFVKKGELIGYSGNTGYSKAPHLHFEVFVKPAADESEGKTIKIRFADT